MEYIPSQEWLVTDEKKAMRVPCDSVNFPISDEDIITIKKMIAYIDESYLGNAKKYNIRPGIGIAANQLGSKKRMFYIHLNDEEKKEHKYLLINPVKISESATKAFLGVGEGCLSVLKDRNGFVIRSLKVSVKGYDYFQKKEITLSANGGILSMCLQHELDHLDGKLYYDRINPLNPNYYNKDWVQLGLINQNKNKK